MSKTKIEWCDNTINPIVGCSKVSEGCENCYAETMARRLKGMGLPQYEDVVDENGWTGKLSCLQEKKLDKLKTIKQGRIFVGSMTDLWHEACEWDNLDAVFDACSNPNCSYLFLTKRPHEMLSWLEMKCFHVPQNYWFGVTAENQQRADERIPILLDIPAKVRFVSLEPLLGSVNLDPFLKTGKLHWVIVGGETGRNARPMHPEWVKNIISQCNQYNAPAFFKSWGEYIPFSQLLKQTITYKANSKRQFNFCNEPFYKIGKKHSGHLVDGKEYRDFPK